MRTALTAANLKFSACQSALNPYPHNPIKYPSVFAPHVSEGGTDAERRCHLHAYCSPAQGRERTGNQGYEQEGRASVSGLGFRFGVPGLEFWV